MLQQSFQELSKLLLGTPALDIAIIVIIWAGVSLSLRLRSQ